jgi:hypothetical protein
VGKSWERLAKIDEGDAAFHASMVRVLSVDDAAATEAV